LSDVSIGILASGVREISSLTEFYMTHNDLSQPNGVKLLEALEGKKSLKCLALNSCNIDAKLL
jgi:hypothetical protein